MGGTQESIQAGVEYENLRNELDIVYCAGYLSLNGNNALLDYTLIHRQMTKAIMSYLKQYGIKCRAINLGGMGGGGIFDIWESLKVAWEHREIIEIILSFLKGILMIPKYLNIKLIRQQIRNTKPRVTISLRLKTNSEFHEKVSPDVHSMAKERLINLKNIIDELCIMLKKDHNLFLFDKDIRIEFHSKSYRADYFIPYEQQNGFNEFRLLRLFKNIKIMKNLGSSYNFTKWFAISRTDSYVEYIQNYWTGSGKDKKYFFIFSCCILSDYFQS